MTQIPSGGMQRAKVRATNDIYTALAACGLFAVLGTIAFVIYRCSELLGTAFPGFQGS